MTFTHLFECATSPLYQSNDGRLKLERPVFHGDGYRLLDTETERTVLVTNIRPLLDAFIAGYDFARENQA